MTERTPSCDICVEDYCKGEEAAETCDAYCFDPSTIPFECPICGTSLAPGYETEWNEYCEACDVCFDSGAWESDEPTESIAWWKERLEKYARRLSPCQRCGVLTLALAAAIGHIREWHCMGMEEADADRAWALYLESPEMIRLRSAFASTPTPQDEPKVRLVGRSKIEIKSDALGVDEQWRLEAYECDEDEFTDALEEVFTNKHPELADATPPPDPLAGLREWAEREAEWALSCKTDEEHKINVAWDDGYLRACNKMIDKIDTLTGGEGEGDEHT